MNIYKCILVQKRPILIDENQKRLFSYQKLHYFDQKCAFLVWNHEHNHTLFLTSTLKNELFSVKMKSQNLLDGAVKRKEYIISVTSVASESTGIDFIEANILFLLFEMTDKFVGW